MDFNEAQARLTHLSEQLKQEKISHDVYVAEVNGLRVMDAQGVWWQPDPHGQGWLRWDGAQWQKGIPRELEKPVSGPSIQPQPPASRLSSRLMDPGSFLETARKLPLSQRPQAWWDALAVLGGATAGYLWLLYSSVRAFNFGALLVNYFPQLSAVEGPNALNLLARLLGFLLDKLPTIILIGIPLLIILARKTAMKLLTPLWTKIQQMPAKKKLGIGLGAAAGIWLVSTYVLPIHEGMDYFSSMLMVAIPVALVWFRKETDRMLAPLQVIRKRIPKTILIGMGIAIPYFTALFLHNVMRIGNYPLMHFNVVIGTLLSYATLRNPDTTRGSSVKLDGVTALVTIVFSFIMACTASIGAHDFLKDPFNLQDGLRTEGWAPVIAGISTTVVSILVNGVEVAKALIQDTKPVKEGEEPVQKHFIVVVNTVGKDGSTSTTLTQGENDIIYVYAHCEEVGKGPFPQGDNTISFSLRGAEGWVAQTDMGTQHGSRCAQLSIASESTSGDPPASCTIHVGAGAGGGLIGADVTINLSLTGDMRGEFF